MDFRQIFALNLAGPNSCAKIISVRIVLDTNVLVSACWKPAGLEAQVVDMAIAGELVACVSQAVLAEYRDVLARPKLAAVHERAKELLAGLERTAVVVQPVNRIAASIDEDDNRFLECAEAAAADFLITGNLRHYPASSGATRVVNARTFFDGERGIPTLLPTR